MNLCQFQGKITRINYRESKNSILRIGLKVKKSEHFTFVDVSVWGEQADYYRTLEEGQDIIVYCKYDKYKKEGVYHHNFNVSHLFVVR